jgi:hypothetical protein
MADSQSTSATPTGGSNNAQGAGTPAAGVPVTPPAGYDFSIDPAIESLNDDDLAYLSPTLRELIAHRIDGINYAEGRRGQLAAIGGAIAAAGVALLPFASGVEWIPLKAVYYELSLASLALGTAIWIVYARQTNYNYPFKTELATWKWFYHQALPDKSQFGPGIVKNRGKRRRESENQQYGEQWSRFTEQVQGLSTPKVDATQDLKQLYQLHVNERYKNLFLTRLRGLLVWGLVVAFGGALLTFGIAVAVYDEPDHANRSDWRHDGVELIATWKETGAVRADGLSTRDVQFRVQATLANRGTRPVTGTALLMLDRDNESIPVEFLLGQNESAILAPGEAIDIQGYFWVAGADREQMKTLSSR